MTSDAPILAASADGREQTDPRRRAALGSQSGPAVNATAPQIKAGLAAAGVPAAAQRHIAGQVRACLHDRLVASDPTSTPPGCRRSPAETMLPAAADHAITAGAARAMKRDFTAALQRTLWYQVGTFLLAFLLMLALPRRAARSVHDTEPVHDTQALPAKG
jgi:hypothetical protein